jgi:peptidoglycan/LPS O-acetylase OafA/YrhL
VNRSTGEEDAGGWPGRALRALVVPPSSTVPALDLLRTAAIVLVIGNHVAAVGAQIAPAGPWDAAIFKYGWTGVDLFFVLSGFLIGRQLQKELQRTETVDVPRFLLRRGLRIWPLYFSWVAFLALALGKWRGMGPDLVFLSNYRQGEVSGGWSLSTEEQFYLVVPLLLLGLHRLLGRRAQGWVPLLLLAIMPAVRWLTLHHTGSDGAAALYGPIHTHCDGLLVGLFLAWVSVHIPRALEPGRPHHWRAPLLAMGAGLGLRQLDPALLNFTGLALFYGGLVALGLRSGPRARAFAGWPGFYLLSRLSYGMYLEHFEIVPRVLPPTSRVLAPLFGQGIVLSSVLFLVAVLVSAAGAALTFVLVEEPFLALRTRWEARRRTWAPAEPAIAAESPAPAPLTRPG